MLIRLLELIRFSHTLFALPFALLAATMAWSANFRAKPPVAFRWLDLLGIVVCMVFARSAAMAFNRLLDAGLDARNMPRAVAMNFVPVTTCTDLLRPGGYARLVKYLAINKAPLELVAQAAQRDRFYMPLITAGDVNSAGWQE